MFVNVTELFANELSCNLVFFVIVYGAFSRHTADQLVCWNKTITYVCVRVCLYILSVDDGNILNSCHKRCDIFNMWQSGCWHF